MYENALIVVFRILKINPFTNHVCAIYKYEDRIDTLQNHITHSFYIYFINPIYENEAKICFFRQFMTEINV